MRTKLRHVFAAARAPVVAFAMTAIALTVSACSTGVAGRLQQLRKLEANCHHRAIDMYFALDLGPLDRKGAPLAEHLQALGEAADQVAACGGYLDVEGFARSAAATHSLASASFPASFGTDNARLIHNAKIAQSVSPAVKSALPTALAAIAPDGNDVIDQLVLARQFGQQRNDAATLWVEIATSGIATLGPVPMNTPAFTNATAVGAGQRVPVPDLEGAVVRVVGVGATAGPALPTSVVWHNQMFYRTACRRTRASCLVITNYTPGE